MAQPRSGRDTTPMPMLRRDSMFLLVELLARTLMRDCVRMWLGLTRRFPLGS